MMWNSISDGKYPDLDDAVILAKEPTDDLLKQCRVGRLVLEDNTGEKGWFIGNDNKVITVLSWPYWMRLIEIPEGMPKTEDEKILKVHLEGYIDNLRLFEKKFQLLAAMMIYSGKGIYPLDYFISGILNRSLSLIYGFETLIASANFLSAVHLVRPHLDNYLRLSAAWLVDRPHDFATNVWKGDVIRKMKDRDGRPMTDSYLKDKASEDYPWIAAVYEATSGFIHFGEKHIFNATKLTKEKEQSLTTYIGKVDNEVSYDSKIEATIGMIEISNCIAKQVYGWIETKRING